MQYQYVTMDFPTEFEAPTGGVGKPVTAQILGIAGRAVYQLINEWTGSDQIDEFGCLPWRGHWRNASASPKASRNIFSVCATSVPREKTIKTTRGQASFGERDKQQMSRSEASNASCHTGEKMSNSSVQSHLLDCARLSATELRRRYSGEANTHRNMLQRAGSRGNIINPKFRAFGDFLRHVGPKPIPSATLDRIDNSDPEYAPGKVRWADKRTQNSNKGDTLLFNCSRTGDTYTASRLAKKQKVSPSTIRKRKERGWTDAEIIEGRRAGARQDYLAYQGARASRTPREHSRTAHQTQAVRSAQDILWQRNAESAENYRNEYGEEYCLPTHQENIEEFGEYGYNINEGQYIFGKFAKWWKVWKPHIRREKLSPWHQRAIVMIEAREAPLAQPSHRKASVSHPMTTDELRTLL